LLRPLLVKKAKNHPNRLFCGFRFNASLGRNAGNQVFHLSPRRCIEIARTCHAARDKIKTRVRTSGSVRAPMPHKFALWCAFPRYRRPVTPSRKLAACLPVRVTPNKTSLGRKGLYQLVAGATGIGKTLALQVPADAF